MNFQADFTFVIRDAGVRMILGPRKGAEQAAKAAQACSLPFVSISLDHEAAQGAGYKSCVSQETNSMTKPGRVLDRQRRVLTEGGA